MGGWVVDTWGGRVGVHLVGGGGFAESAGSQGRPSACIGAMSAWDSRFWVTTRTRTAVGWNGGRVRVLVLNCTESNRAQSHYIY
jgi:hypothetical protein